MKKSSFVRKIGLVLLILILINGVVDSLVKLRIDLTEDRRYTLSKHTKALVREFKKTVTIDVLLDGVLPPELSRLKKEVQQLLIELSAENTHIKYNFIDPLDAARNNVTKAVEQMKAIGLTPTNVILSNGPHSSKTVVFPWAIVHYRKKTIKVPLLKNKLGASSEERVTNSIQELEYHFANAFKQAGSTINKSIAIIKGKGTLEERYTASYVTELRKYYRVEGHHVKCNKK